MTREASAPKLSAELLALVDRFDGDQVSVGEMVHTIQGNAYLVLIILLSLPFISPIPLPGISAPFGLVVAVLGFRMAMGLPEKLPGWLMRRQFSPRTMGRIVRGLGKVLGFIERHARPTMTHLATLPSQRTLNLFLIGFAGAVLAIPAPIPFINGLPAWWIILLTIGTLERDGRYILAGYVLYVLGAIYIGLALWLGGEAVVMIFTKIAAWARGLIGV